MSNIKEQINSQYPDKSLGAFYGNQELKDELMEQLEAHYAADEIGYIHSHSHEDMGEKFNIPLELCYLMDDIFGGLPVELAPQWPLRFIAAINVGADLSLVWNRFAVWLLIDPNHGVYQFNSDQSIVQVANLHQQVIDGYTVSINDWITAWFNASDASWDATSAAASCAASCAARVANAMCVLDVRAASRLAAYAKAENARSAARFAAYAKAEYIEEVMRANARTAATFATHAKIDDVAAALGAKIRPATIVAQADQLERLLSKCGIVAVLGENDGYTSES